MRGNVNGNPTGTANPSTDELLSDVSGILLLLTSAVRSLQTEVAESTCVETLRGCIREIRERYQLAEADLNNGTQSGGASAESLIRLLEYVECEVRERLNDGKSARELRLCIATLANTPQPFMGKAWVRGFGSRATAASVRRVQAGKTRTLN